MDKLSPEEIAEVERGLSKKLSEIIKKAVAEANSFANVYGLEARMAFDLSPMGPKTEVPQSLVEESIDLGELGNG
jgi:hypothetical protein